MCRQIIEYCLFLSARGKKRHKCCYLNAQNQENKVISRVCVDIKGYFFSSLLTGVLTLTSRKPSTRPRRPTGIALLRKIKLILKVLNFHFRKHSTIWKGSNVCNCLMANIWHCNLLNLHLLSHTDITYKLRSVETTT